MDTDPVSPRRVQAPVFKRVRSITLALVVATVPLAMGAQVLTRADAATRPVTAADDASTEDLSFSFGPREAVPQRPCQPDDRPETDLQGRVPPADVISGRAAEGYTCNLELVGNFVNDRMSGGITFENFENCVYYGAQGSTLVGQPGVQVLDVSDVKNPVATDLLTTPAMAAAGETVRVNAKRKLLAATGYTNNYPEATENAMWLDIYDISGDCRHPRLVSSKDMSPAAGHEGWFSPDGMTFYMSTSYGKPHAKVPTLFPIDITNPAEPRLLASVAFDSNTHGGVTTEDGKKTYACQVGNPGTMTDAMLTLNTQQIAKRRENPQPKVIDELPLEDNMWCQGAYRVTYDGKPYLIQFGERSGTHTDLWGVDCSRADDNWANFGYPRIIDISNEQEPRVVGRALLEVHLPEHCRELAGEGSFVGLGYSAHFCSPDRLYDPTILACSWFYGGLRVLDIRDPSRPVEIGYYNPGTNLAVGTAARPVIRSDLGQIWFTNDSGGFYAVRFEDGIWPFKDSAPCPEFNDYYYAQYNPGSSCRTANFKEIGQPAPAAPRYR